MTDKQPFLLVAFGSYGDVLPCLCLAQLLARAGFPVSFAANPEFAAVVEGLGMGTSGRLARATAGEKVQSGRARRSLAPRRAHCPPGMGM